MVLKGLKMPYVQEKSVSSETSARRQLFVFKSLRMCLGTPTTSESCHQILVNESVEVLHSLILILMYGLLPKVQDYWHYLQV